MIILWYDSILYVIKDAVGCLKYDMCNVSLR